jgi:hypothetical protein
VWQIGRGFVASACRGLVAGCGLRPVGVVGVVGLFVCVPVSVAVALTLSGGVCVSALRAVAVSGGLYRWQAVGLSNKCSKKRARSFEQVFETSVRLAVWVSLSESFQPNLGNFQPNPQIFQPNPDRIFTFCLQPNLKACCLVWHYKNDEQQLVGYKGRQG